MLTFETELGTCALTWSDAGLTSFHLPGEPAIAHGARGPAAAPVPEWVREAVAGVQALLAGERRDLRDVPLDESGLGDFQRAVLRATRAVGPGETTTYGAIAAQVGGGGDARAVGGALGANPYPVIVPCHRVLAAGGALTGFSAPGGIATKRRMLEIEGAPGFQQRSLFA